MRSRWIVTLGLGLCALCVVPQAAQPTQDDGEVTMKQRVKPHIEAGVEHLRGKQNANGTWAWRNNDPANFETVGATALCALALMENGVSVTDKAIVQAGSVVRRGAGNYNYGNCLCLLFLDRIHKNNMRLDKDNIPRHNDAGSILSIAHKICAGQMADGGWGYNYPGGKSDNSNTQFAVVALWVARKYEPAKGGRIHTALKAAEQKFRKSQRPFGAWAYDQEGVNLNPTPSMTLAGILGLALGAGSDHKRQEATFRGAGAGGSGTTADPYQKLELDPAVAKARKYVAEALPGILANGADTEHTTYTLWSLERVCKLYRWKKKEFEGLDWFAMGANWFISKQRRDGGWAVDGLMSNPNVDTAFALLFLGESNLLGDLATAEFKKDEGNYIVPQKRKIAEETKVDAAKDSAELAAKLVDAPPGKARDDILGDFEEKRGSEYTAALAAAIDKISNPQAKEAARDTLRKRLQRLSKKSLGNYMTPEEGNTVEIRLAAATAAKFKNDADLAELVIPLLKDENDQVRNQARDTLVSLAGGIDLGPSVERWSRWLEESKKTKKDE